MNRLRRLWQRLRPGAAQANAPAAVEEPIQWRAHWHEETLELAYHEARETQNKFEALPDTVDAKVVTVFTVGSVIAGLVPTLRALPRWSPSWWLWVVAMVAWAYSAIECVRAFRPRRYRWGPDPGAMGRDEWLSLDRKHFYLYSLRYMKRWVEQNRAQATAKARALRHALIAVALEVGFLAVALLLA